MKRPRARPSSIGRPGPSPRQKGSSPGSPGVAPRSRDPGDLQIRRSKRRASRRRRASRAHLFVELVDPRPVGPDMDRVLTAIGNRPREQRDPPCFADSGGRSRDPNGFAVEAPRTPLTDSGPTTCPAPIREDAEAASRSSPSARASLRARRRRPDLPQRRRRSAGRARRGDVAESRSTRPPLHACPSRRLRLREDPHDASGRRHRERSPRRRAPRARSAAGPATPRRDSRRATRVRRPCRCRARDSTWRRSRRARPSRAPPRSPCACRAQASRDGHGRRAPPRRSRRVR